MWSTVLIGEAAANTVSLRSAVAEMAVVDENRSGYERDLFPHWVDEDRDGCNIRKEVLIAKATTPPVVGPRCALVEASGILTMINATWTQQTDLDIDHLVPLAEAWDSGASAWSTAQRRAYANDLSDGGSLVAVTDNENQSKADEDPATWMPPYEPARCFYVGEWVVVKLRWRLTVDTVE